MKQLKCIVNDYSVIQNNGLIDINFQQSIEIKPNSTIALDKISLAILPNPEGTIILEDSQIITIRTQASGPKTQVERSVTLPAGTYTYNHGPLTPETQGTPDLLLTLNNLFNGLLNGTPKLLNQKDTPELDYGLGFKWMGELDNSVYKLSCHIYQQAFVGNQAFPKELNNNMITNENMSQSNGKGLVANLAGNFWATSNSPLIQGCMNGWINTKIINIDQDNFQLGLSFASAMGVAPIIQYGITCVNDKVYILNNGVMGTELEAALFKSVDGNRDNLKIWFFTDASNNSLRMSLSLGTGDVYFTTTDGAFTGYDFNTAYHISVKGTSLQGAITKSNQFLDWRWFLQPNITVNEIGTIYNKVPKPNEHYLSQPNLDATTPDRIVQIDFTQAPLLINSLGYSDNILQGKVSFTDHLVLNASNGIDFTNWYDIALDVLNLNLESYVGSSGNNIGSNKNSLAYKNMISGKKNTLAYFLIQRLNPNESVFFSESKQLIFLSLNNLDSMNVSSLQFRIYNVATQTPINFSTASFNLFISD